MYFLRNFDRMCFLVFFFFWGFLFLFVDNFLFLFFVLLVFLGWVNLVVYIVELFYVLCKGGLLLFEIVGWVSEEFFKYCCFLWGEMVYDLFLLKVIVFFFVGFLWIFCCWWYCVDDVFNRYLLFCGCLLFVVIVLYLCWLMVNEWFFVSVVWLVGLICWVEMIFLLFFWLW